MPAALERGGGAVPLPNTEAVILASKKNRVAETLTFAKGLANALSSTIAEVIADSEVIANPQILPDPQVFADPKILADPQAHSGSET